MTGNAAATASVRLDVAARFSDGTPVRRNRGIGMDIRAIASCNRETPVYIQETGIYSWEPPLLQPDTVISSCSQGAAFGG